MTTDELQQRAITILLDKAEDDDPVNVIVACILIAKSNPRLTISEIVDITLKQLDL